MKFYQRDLDKKITANLQPNKVIILLGARRTGKTFLLNQIIKRRSEKYLFLNGEDVSTFDLLKRRSIENYKNLLGTKRLLIIDEAQKIPDIGSILKLMIDGISNLKVIVSGSSAFDMMNTLGEPLTGRKYTFNLFPLSVGEIYNNEGETITKDRLFLMLIYGNYPELTTLRDINSKREYLREIINSYLLKDILLFENIKNSTKIFNLLRLIAFQIGGEVSYQELGKQLGMSKNTVEKYLNLLQKVFILFKLGGFSKNLRKEITKNSKWYFYDNGIRNAIVANFLNISVRGDVGQLWENFIISERMKFIKNNSLFANTFFWRTYDRQEIDLVEERDGRLFAYEFKWKNEKVKKPRAWSKAYPTSSFEVISQDNYLQWLR